MRAKEEYEARKAKAKAKAKADAKAEKKPWWFANPDPVVKFTGWVAIYTLALVIATSISAIVLYKTDITLHDTLVASQRPWVAAEISVNAPVVLKHGRLQLPLTVVMKNTGLSPAADIAAYATIFFKNPRPLTHLETQQERCRPSGVDGLAPNQGLGYTLFPAEIRTEILDAQVEQEGTATINSANIDLLGAHVVFCINYGTALDEKRRHASRLFRLERGDSESSPPSLNLLGTYAD
jgi:hypothetical protein